MLQQTPCAQLPLAHSAASAHSCPVGFSPHEPFWQVAGLAHSASRAQLLAQRAPPHLKGAQLSPAGGAHCPSPSQLNCPVWMLVAASQLSGWQTMPRG